MKERGRRTGTTSSPAQQRFFRITAALVIGLLIVFVSAVTASGTTTVTRVGTDPLGVRNSSSPSISPDGRFVGYTVGNNDIYLRDTQTGSDTLITPGGWGLSSSVSNNGSYVAFASTSSNLVPGDTNGVADIMIRNVAAGTTSRVSTHTSGAQANNHSYNPSVSYDGHLVAFQSNASNLVYGDLNNYADIFVKNTQSGETTRVSTNSASAQVYGGESSLPTISPDGRFVIFQSNSPELVSGDTNNTSDIFVKDTQTGQTQRVSTDSSGAQFYFWQVAYEECNDEGDSCWWIYENHGSSVDGTISADGRYVTFTHELPSGTNEAFVKDTLTGQLTQLSNGGGNSAAVTPDGRFVSYGAGNIYRYDMSAGTSTKLSVAYDGGEANNGSGNPAISADGSRVAFASPATNLVPGDTNNLWDIFMAEASVPAGDTTAPAVSNIQPTGAIMTESATISAYYSDSGSGIDSASVAVYLDGSQQGGCTASASSVSCPASGLGFGGHTIDVSVSDNAGNTGSGSGSFSVGDNAGPVISGIQPAGTIFTDSASVSAYFSDIGPSSGIDESSANLTVSGGTVSGCVVTAAGITCDVSGLAAGDHTIDVSVADYAGNTSAGSGAFTVAACQPAKPAVNMAVQAVYWANFNDYQARQLSVDLRFVNAGPGTAYGMQIIGAVNTMGAGTITALPASLGDIAAGSNAPVTLQYQVPGDVTTFKSSIYMTTMDACDASHYYPGPMPGA